MKAVGYAGVDSQFYPTPETLGRRLLRHVDWKRVTAILEPSAGKGDLLKLVNGKALITECIEIDPHLQAILRDQGHHVIGSDFLEHETYTTYDLIVMNPPFADGAKHLLKALELCRHGGQVCCILNAETLKNPCTVHREKLCDLLLEYGAKIEYVQDGFAHAERKADVECALIYVDIKPQEITLDMFAGLETAQEYADTHERFNDTQLATNDIISNVLRRYNDECRMGISLIDMYERLEASIPTSEVARRSTPLISFGVNSPELAERHGDKISKKNLYVRELRYKYWKLLFQSDEFSRLLTIKAREQFQHRMQELRSYDFTLSNIKALQLQMSQGLTANIEDAILEQFERLTYAHSLDKSSNIHYFDGWRTNDAFMIKPKVIIPCYGVYDSRWGGCWSLYKGRDTLEELEKIFTYLDGGKTEGASIREWDTSRHYDGERLHFKYFDVEIKKKGTMHVWFTVPELLKKFNIFGANKKGWLPNGYGQRAYDTMTDEEKHVIDDFQGVQEYNKVMANQGYYLNLDTGNIMQIAMEGKK